MDYLLGTYRRLFLNFSMWYPRHNSYNYVILGCLHSATLREHTQYLGRHTWFPLYPPWKPTMEYNIFVELCQVVLKPPVR